MHLFKNVLQSGDFLRSRLLVYVRVWTDERTDLFQYDDVIHHVLLL